MAVTERPRAADLRDQLLEQGDKLRELRSIPPERRPDSWDDDVKKASRSIVALDTEFEATRHAEEHARSEERHAMETLAWNAAVEAAKRNPNGQIRGPEAAFSLATGEAQSWGEQFIREAFGDDGRPKQDMRRSADVEVRSPEVRNLLTGGAFGSGADAFKPIGTPFLPPQGVQQRRLFVRDLLGVQQTGLDSVPYIRELNATTNETGAISAVPEASAKPEVTMQFTRDDAPVRKLAAWIQATYEAVQDAATLRGYIDTRLIYMLALAEEVQILNGAGTSGNIRGIRLTPNVQTQAQQGDFFKTIGLAIAKVELADGEPDGVVCHPTDYWTAITTRQTAQFDGEGLGNVPFSMPPPNVWGLPVVRSRTMPPFKALVGNFRLGATLFEREGTVIRTTDSHASLFISNTVVILAEKRDALAVYRPDWFVDATVP